MAHDSKCKVLHAGSNNQKFNYHLTLERKITLLESSEVERDLRPATQLRQTYPRSYVKMQQNQTSSHTKISCGNKKAVCIIGKTPFGILQPGTTPEEKGTEGQPGENSKEGYTNGEWPWAATLL
jgi:hypothetical protein